MNLVNHRKAKIHHAFGFSSLRTENQGRVREDWRILRVIIDIEFVLYNDLIIIITIIIIITNINKIISTIVIIIILPQ